MGGLFFFYASNSGFFVAKMLRNGKKKIDTPEKDCYDKLVGKGKAITFQSRLFFIPEVSSF